MVWAVFSTVWVAEAFRTRGVEDQFLRSSESVTVIDQKTTLGGHIGEPSVARISVPHALRGAMEGVDRTALDSGRAAFDMDVSWGRRFEPWITAVRPRRPAPAG